MSAEGGLHAEAATVPAHGNQSRIPVTFDDDPDLISADDDDRTADSEAIVTEPGPVGEYPPNDVSEAASETAQLTNLHLDDSSSTGVSPRNSEDHQGEDKYEILNERGDEDESEEEDEESEGSFSDADIGADSADEEARTGARVCGIGLLLRMWVCKYADVAAMTTGYRRRMASGGIRDGTSDGKFAR